MDKFTHQRRDNLDVTALLIACKNDQLQDVRHLVENCGVDVNQPGTLLWEEEGYEQTLAIALHTAVIAGHLNVVQYLVEDCKAHVNIKSKSSLVFQHHRFMDKGLTPLHVAIIHLTDQIQVDMIRYLAKNGADIDAYDDNGNPCWSLTFDVDVTKLLIELSVDLQTKNEIFQTIIYMWASSEDPRAIEVMQLLLDKGVDITEKNCDGLTPIMLAALEVHSAPDSSMFQFLYEQETQPLSRSDKIDALELLGAVYTVGEDPENALMYWRMAMSLRFDVMPAMPKVTSVLSDVARKAFEISEVENLEQLEEMAFYDHDSMQLQAHLIAYRILGIQSIQTWECLTIYALDCWASSNGSRFLNFSMLVLECSQSMEEALWITTVDTIRRLAVSFYTLRSEESHEEDRQLVSFANVMAVLRCAANELHRSGTSNNDYENGVSCSILLDCVIQLTILLISMTLTDEESFELKHCLYQLVLLDERSSHNGYNLLLLACSSSSYYFNHHELEMDVSPEVDFGKLPSVEVIRLLLEVGADPDSTDEMGDTGLHVLARSGVNFMSPTVQALFEHGTHLDQTNMVGETVADLVHKDSPHQINTILVTPLEFPSLKCLTARAYRQQYYLRTIFDNPSIVPSELWKFILQH